MQSYFADMIAIQSDGSIVHYNYTFRERNMRQAKLHCREVCEQIDAIPIPSVWRVNREDYSRYMRDYALPKPVSWIDADGEELDL